MSFASLRKELNVSWSGARNSAPCCIEAPEVTPDTVVDTVLS